MKSPNSTMIFSLISLLITILAIGHILFGSCQTSKYHYIVQCYYWPKQEFGIIDVPNNYNGQWRMWNKNGKLQFSCFFINGKAHGVLKRWHGNGNLRSKDNYFLDKLEGQCFEWNEDGILIKVAYYKDGEFKKEKTLDPKSGKLIVAWEAKEK